MINLPSWSTRTAAEYATYNAEQAGSAAHLLIDTLAALRDHPTPAAGQIPDAGALVDELRDILGPETMAAAMGVSVNTAKRRVAFALSRPRTGLLIAVLRSAGAAGRPRRTGRPGRRRPARRRAVERPDRTRLRRPRRLCRTRVRQS